MYKVVAFSLDTFFLNHHQETVLGAEVNLESTEEQIVRSVFVTTKLIDLSQPPEPIDDDSKNDQLRGWVRHNRLRSLE
jgi:hypothetical protein